MEYSDDVNDGLVVSFDGANYIPKDCNKKINVGHIQIKLLVLLVYNVIKHM